VLGVHVLPKVHNGLSLAMKFSFFIFPFIHGLILALKMFHVCQCTKCSICTWGILGFIVQDDKLHGVGGKERGQGSCV
jgi:hypothetical protein